RSNLGFPDAWARAVADPNSFAQDKALPVADSVAMKGVSVRSSAINLNEASTRITKLRLYPWALLHDGMPTWRELQASVAAGTESPEHADPLPVLRAEASMLL